MTQVVFEGPECYPCVMYEWGGTPYLFVVGEMQEVPHEFAMSLIGNNPVPGQVGENYLKRFRIVGGEPGGGDE